MKRAVQKPLPMLDLDLDGLRAGFGFGVAGNFAGHLEQAGEASDFESVGSMSAEAPKGIFPFYAPGADSFLNVFPLSSDRISRPAPGESSNLQIEPEAGLLCAVGYAADGSVGALAPRAIGAFNDCSIRRPGATKISQKKNWGPDSKGVAGRLFAIDDLDPEGPTATLRLACFLRRGDQVQAYGVDSPLPGYSYYGRELLDWICDRLANQSGEAGTPLEDVGRMLLESGRPEQVLIGIGATRYTPYGEQTFLEAGDEAIVVVYDRDLNSPEQVMIAAQRDRLGSIEAASVLIQRVCDIG